MAFRARAMGISIHSLRMEGDVPRRPSGGQQKNFNPLPPHGGRLANSTVFCTLVYFNPLPPHGGRLYTSGNISDVRYISIHSLRMEGDSSSIYILSPPMHISIHSLRMEGDPLAQRAEHNPAISIHSLRMEGDLTHCHILSRSRTFQSTPSAWRETFFQIHFFPPRLFQSTPSAWRETIIKTEKSFAQVIFQSTPSAWRETMSRLNRRLSLFSFQSTPSAWRETVSEQCEILRRNHFNPLPPHGGRPQNNLTDAMNAPFQSTPSAWRETSLGGCARSIRKYFNPLPPHGGRLAAKWRYGFMWYFNPLPPHGGRPPLAQRAQHHPAISIHSLRMEGDA